MEQKIQHLYASLREYIVSHEYEEIPILTVYANVDSTDSDNRRDRPEWLIELKNEAKRLEEKHGSEGLQRKEKRHQWSEVEEAILAHLGTTKAQGKSVVVFTDLEDYLTIDVPVALPTKLYYGAPQLKHLLVALDNYKKYSVILFSEVEQKVFQVFLTSAAEKATVQLSSEGGLSLRPGGRKARTQASDRRDFSSERTLVAEAASQINDYVLGDPEVERLVFGGNLKLAHAVKNQLHPAVAASLVTIEPIDINSTVNEISAAIKQISNEHEKEHDLALINDLVTRRHDCGTAVLEWQGVQLALSEGRAEKLVVALPIKSEEIDPLLIQAIVNNIEIEFLHGSAADQLEAYGGVAAKLYFSGK